MQISRRWKRKYGASSMRSSTTLAARWSSCARSGRTPSAIGTAYRRTQRCGHLLSKICTITENSPRDRHTATCRGTQGGQVARRLSHRLDAGRRHATKLGEGAQSMRTVRGGRQSSHRQSKQRNVTLRCETPTPPRDVQESRKESRGQGQVLLAGVRSRAEHPREGYRRPEYQEWRGLATVRRDEDSVEVGAGADRHGRPGPRRGRTSPRRSRLDSASSTKRSGSRGCTHAAESDNIPERAVDDRESARPRTGVAALSPSRPADAEPRRTAAAVDFVAHTRDPRQPGRFRSRKDP